MSAPHIPNLSTLGRSGFRGRGRAKAESGEGSHKSQDELVQQTDNDAASSRVSAVHLGYLDDPFAQLLTPGPVNRRLPLMNRGTYTRTIGIDKIVDAFIASHPGRKQVISLGAGSDTRFFCLRRRYSDLDLVYHEIDFEANTKAKIDRLMAEPFRKAAREMCSVDVDEFQVVNSNLYSADYNIHAQDLRNLPNGLPGVDTALPTLLISECCLIYLSLKHAEAVMTHFTQMFPKTPLAVIIYEPIRPDDAFGKMMVENMGSRGLQFHTLSKYADLARQRERLGEHQFEPRAEDIDFVWKNWVSPRERDRIEKLELMDEIEEFVLLTKHYCISWGWKGWEDDRGWSEIPTSATVTAAH